MADNCYLFFNSNIKVNCLKIDKIASATIEGKDELTEVKKAAYGKKAMTANTILWNDFSSTVDCSYFDPVGEIANATFSIYRKTPDQKYYNYICKIDNGATKFIDYNVTTDNYYHYLAAVEVTTSEGLEYKLYQNYTDDTQSELDYLYIQWDDWTICDIEDSTEDDIYIKTGDIWHLKYNMSDDVTMTMNTGVTMWETLGRFGKYSIGQKNFDSGSISCLLGDIDYYNDYAIKNKFKTDVKTGQLYESDEQEKVFKQKICGYNEKINKDSKYGRQVEKEKAWKTFITNGKLKLLKDYKGNTWIVMVQANPTYEVEYKSNLMETMISFEWQEVEDVSKVAIVEIM